MSYDEERLATAAEMVRELARLGDVARNCDSHPWRGYSGPEASLALERRIADQLPQLADRLRRRLDAFTQLCELGFGRTTATLASLDEPVAAARDALRMPQVPRNWLDGDVGQFTERVIEVATWARKYRAASATLPMLNLGVAMDCDADELLTAVSRSSDAAAGLRQEHPGVRGLLGRVDEACGALAKLRRCLSALAAADRDLRASIGAAPSDALGAARRVSQLARCVRDVGPCRPSWFVPNTRAALRTAASQAQQNLDRAAAIEAELRTRLGELIFDSSDINLLRDIQRYDRWWKRLLPGWRRRRRHILEHFHDRKSVSPKRILADAALLTERLACNERARELASAHSDDVLRFDDGTVNWRATAQALEQLDRHLSDWAAPVPDELTALLIDWEHSRAESVIDDADTLDRTYEDMCRAADAVGRFVRHVGGRGQRWDRLPLQGLAEWAAGCQEQLVALRETLERLVCVLRDGQDLAWDSAEGVLTELKELRQLRENVRAAYRKIQPAIPGIAFPEERDWRDEDKLARSLIGFVAPHDGQLPPHLIALCSDPARRHSVSSLVRQAQEAHDDVFKEAWAFLTSLFRPDENVSCGITINTASIEDLLSWIDFLHQRIHELRDLLNLRSLLKRLSEFGLSSLFDLLQSGEITDKELPDAFLRRFWELWLDAAFDSDPHLRSFQSISHDEVVERFRTLDEAAISASAQRIRGKLLSDPQRPNGNEHGGSLSKELTVLRREMQKKKKHLPLRQLFSQIPRALLRLKPCVMMSPLSVSTYFDSDSIRFDLVIFDEASQVRPHDSIGAVYRGNQLIVAGDQRQLPPTTFFEHVDLAVEEDEAQEKLPTAGLESILDVCQCVGLPQRRLRWHYRSRREPLIAFSNKHIYGDELMTFPSVLDADGDPAIEFFHVPAGRFKGGASGGYNPAEARCVAEIVVREMERDRNASVGVVTFGLGQRDAVQDAIDGIRRKNPILDPLFSEDAAEPFFIKNLENVQGDERDLMIFSIGYAPDDTGRFKMHFGPLNQAGGERRLNVAVTRARSRVIVVSSIRADAIDLSRTDARGVKLLRAYLEYAEKGPSVLGSEIREDSERDFDSDFEREVASALESEGFLVKRQVGCGGYRLDLALSSPSRPGRYLLGVECDGATYHRHATARDRDRLRQSVLEQLGWKIVRVWSTSWYRDPKREIQKLRAAFNAAAEKDSARERASLSAAEQAREWAPKRVSPPPQQRAG